MQIVVDYKIVRLTLRPNPWNILKSVDTCMFFWDYSHPQYNASLDKLNSILHRNRVNILPKCVFLNYFSYLCGVKAAKGYG